MSKYDFSLDMTTQNSNSVILKNIASSSKVLELGCAHGRMTKYMKEQLDCLVDIVELDEEAGSVAASWANKSFAANLEDPDIWQELQDVDCKNYDYIIFADVLEHLHDPKRVLTSSKQLLRSDGSIWISIPNIGYNGVVLDLLNENFTYRDTGIMDSTHLKFFSLNSLLKLVEECGLTIAQEHNLINMLACSEFETQYDHVPEAVADFLKERLFGEVYQFVWELKLSQ